MPPVTVFQDRYNEGMDGPPPGVSEETWDTYMAALLDIIVGMKQHEGGVR